MLQFQLMHRVLVAFLTTICFFALPAKAQDDLLDCPIHGGGQGGVRGPCPQCAKEMKAEENEDCGAAKQFLREYVSKNFSGSSDYLVRSRAHTNQKIAEMDCSEAMMEARSRGFKRPSEARDEQAAKAVNDMAELHKKSFNNANIDSMSQAQVQAALKAEQANLARAKASAAAARQTGHGSTASALLNYEYDIKNRIRELESRQNAINFEAQQRQWNAESARAEQEHQNRMTDLGRQTAQLESQFTELMSTSKRSSSVANTPSDGDVRRITDAWRTRPRMEGNDLLLPGSHSGSPYEGISADANGLVDPAVVGKRVKGLNSLPFDTRVTVLSGSGNSWAGSAIEPNVQIPASIPFRTPDGKVDRTASGSYQHDVILNSTGNTAMGGNLQVNDWHSQLADIVTRIDPGLKGKYSFTDDDYVVSSGMAAAKALNSANNGLFGPPLVPRSVASGDLDAILSGQKPNANVSSFPSRAPSAKLDALLGSSAPQAPPTPRNAKPQAGSTLDELLKKK